MSENVSTQLPKSPELEPLPAPRPRLWQVVSYLLIIAGLALLGWGGWLYFQTWLETSQPPPARIVEISVADLETPTPSPWPTGGQTTATVTSTVGKSQLEAQGGSSISDTLSISITATTAAPTLELEPSPAVPADRPDEPAVTEAASPTPEASADAALSLEDNPLVVPEEDAQPAPAAAAAISRIVAESIDLDSPVVEIGWKQIMQNSQLTNVWEVAEYAAGWHKNSLLPGQGGNIVLSGHHNIKGEVFRYIVDLEPGAIISLLTGDQHHDYAVVDKFIVKDKGEPEAVRRENAKWVGPFNEERVTLVTCWPYTNNTHRVIVIAKPVTAAGASTTINAITAGGN